MTKDLCTPKNPADHTFDKFCNKPKILISDCRLYSQSKVLETDCMLFLLYGRLTAKDE